MDPKHDKRVETIPLSHLPRSVLVYDLKEAQKHIADLEAERDELKGQLAEAEEVLGVISAEACVSDTFLGWKVRTLIGKRGE